MYDIVSTSYMSYHLSHWLIRAPLCYMPQAELKKARQEKFLAEKAEKQKEWDLKRKQRKAEELDTQPYIAERS